MARNPLEGGFGGGGGDHRPPVDLDAYAHELNQKNFSRANGWHWFVNRRQLEDGTTERYLDRQNADLIRYKTLPHSQRYLPPPGPD